MNFKRWLPTFLGFPIGGYIATQIVGPLNDPVSAAAGGLLAGAIIGGAQWLALRSRGMKRRWVGYTSAAMAAGSALGATITGAGTEVADVMLWGLVTGAAVGAVQSALLARRPRVSVAWTAVTAAGWSLGWLVTSQVIADIERGHHVFGSSGALVATVLTGLALRHLLATGRPATAASVGP
jgi:hypothetical protein